MILYCRLAIIVVSYSIWNNQSLPTGFPRPQQLAGEEATIHVHATQRSSTIGFRRTSSGRRATRTASSRPGRTGDLRIPHSESNGRFDP